MAGSLCPAGLFTYCWQAHQWMHSVAVSGQTQSLCDTPQTWDVDTASGQWRVTGFVCLIHTQTASVERHLCLWNMNIRGICTGYRENLEDLFKSVEYPLAFRSIYYMDWSNQMSDMIPQLQHTATLALRNLKWSVVLTNMQLKFHQYFLMHKNFS